MLGAWLGHALLRLGSPRSRRRRCQAAPNRIHRSHRNWRAGPRCGQAVLRRPDVRPRTPRVVRDRPGWPSPITDPTVLAAQKRLLTKVTSREPTRAVERAFTTSRSSSPAERSSGKRTSGHADAGPPSWTSHASSPSTGSTASRRSRSIPMEFQLEAVCHSPEGS